LGYSDVEIFLNTSVTDIMNKLVEKLKKRWISIYEKNNYWRSKNRINSILFR
jgi:NADPH-dependent 7-cyano-7-deazaguanine reductase QueF